MTGWQQLVAGAPWFRGEGSYPITAYSEYMPPPRLGQKPYGQVDPLLFREDDPWGWHLTEYEEFFELRPGLQNIGRQLINALNNLCQGKPAQGLAKHKLDDNPYWPLELAKHAGSLHHERCVALLPVALSRTQDDKGRVRWTLFGSSEQGPSRAFWKSFYTAPDQEMPAEQALGILRRLIAAVYDEPVEKLADLHHAGFRIMTQEAEPILPLWREQKLPTWTAPLLLTDDKSLRGVKYLLNFRPFAMLPEPVRKAYLAGELHLLPFPGSLVFWGSPPYLKLQRELPLAMQIPLRGLVDRHVGWTGIRVPQAGWLHDPRPGKPAPTDHSIRNTYKRTHRQARVRRDEDELAKVAREIQLIQGLFSSAPDDVKLYDKPLARNVQLWSHDFHLLIDGPHASPRDLKRAAHAIEQGGLFGYRFQYPAMRVGQHEVYWHRPLVAYHCPKTNQPAVYLDTPFGYLTAYQAIWPDLDKPIELWPRLLQRELHVTALQLFEKPIDERPAQTTRNIRKLLDARQLLGDKPLPRLFARSLLDIPKKMTLEAWLKALPQKSSDPERGRWLAERLGKELEPKAGRLPKALTYQRTAKRSFEVEYWKTIASLATGAFVNKDNADCVQDSPTQAVLKHHERDLEPLGEHLIAHYQSAIANARMKGKAQVGELPFYWRTDFDFSWMGGWRNNQAGLTHERDIIIVIPGRDRSRAVIMADHYDTAYKEDFYEKKSGGPGPRLSAAGADDNHSATAALMLGAPVFMELSKAGKLGCDVWLIHLTGEEFPADCMGARHVCQGLVEGTLKMRLPDGNWHDLSKTRVGGVYVLDMVAHNIDHERDIFQLAPGTSPESMWLAYQAHLANEIWNASVPAWNKKPARQKCGRGIRSADPDKIPDTARHPILRGEVRSHISTRSTLYNTDGQIFSDAGVPVVLFMENYDINRQGYHDDHDTMENIDLDYGAGVAAIAIESVARAATADK